MIAFDTETHLIRQGVLAPRLVCLTWDDGESHDILLREEAIDWMHAMLDVGEELVGHNVAFDMGVMAAADPTLLPKIFAAYEKGLIKDTRIREKLLFLAQGRLTYDFVNKRRASFSLASLVEHHFSINISATKKGEDIWRLRYAELDGVALDDWPLEALSYALDDARWTHQVYVNQCRDFISEGERYGGPHGIRNEDEQVRAAWGLHLMSVWGIRTDPVAVAALEQQLLPRVAAMRNKLEAAGLARLKKVKGEMKLSKDMKAIRARVTKSYAAQNKKPPRTEKGAVSTSRATLVDSGDALLQEFASENSAEKILTTYLPVLQAGTEAPLNPGYDTLKESGRTSSFRPNIQNVPRMGGVRECFVPRPGHVFVAADYSTLELCALAQACLDLLGYSYMADAINDGQDLHLAIAAQLLNMDYEDAVLARKAGDKEVKEHRQLAKALNFGLPGGLGAETFCKFAKSYGVSLEEEYAVSLKKHWLSAWPEMREYFDHVSGLSPFGNDFTVVQLRSGRHRGGTNYTAGCNTYFQGLAADGAKEAIWRVAKECFTSGSVLAQCRPVAFIHDELILEVPEASVDAAARLLCTIMQEAMEIYIPDVKIGVEAVAMARWYKNAEPVFEDGMLVLWTPEA
tara:strand:+ start:134 stop:2020 length:1887 start_codon:yes stop_codon:yes gene_type:complete